MNDEMTSDSYEVGYRKPPKHTQFRKGVSGNPTGRRKKAPNLSVELSSELNSRITVNDNGRRRRISKIRGIFKQLAHRALTGDVRAARLLLSYSEQVLERAALQEPSQPSDLAAKKTATDLSDDELTQLIRDYEDSQEWWERKKFIASRNDSSATESA